MGFDGDAALALQVHRVEHLLHHFALGQRAGHLEQAVRQRGLPWSMCAMIEKLRMNSGSMRYDVWLKSQLSHMSYSNIRFEADQDGIALRLPSIVRRS